MTIAVLDRTSRTRRRHRSRAICLFRSVHRPTGGRHRTRLFRRSRRPGSPQRWQRAQVRARCPTRQTPAARRAARKTSQARSARRGLRRVWAQELSTVLITAVPNTARMIARVQCPVAARYTAPGAQTPAAPTTGSTLVTTVTMPHSAADGSRGSRRSRRRAHPERPR